MILKILLIIESGIINNNFKKNNNLNLCDLSTFLRTLCEKEVHAQIAKVFFAKRSVFHDFRSSLRLYVKIKECYCKFIKRY